MENSVKLNQEEKNQPHWYLGIDFGTTGIAAVLLNTSNGKQHPLYWLSNKNQESDKSSFRLPTAVYCHPQSSKNQSESPLTIAWEALSLNQTRGGIFFEDLKSYLNLGIPYYSRDIQQWLPKLKLGEQIVSLYWIQEASETLLATLTPEHLRLGSQPYVRAVDLNEKALQAALGGLEGVILSVPAKSSEIYRFNLREAILKLKLCERVEQIFFVEEAIATLLAYFPGKNQSPQTTNTLKGYTLVINAGATNTELALVNLPANPDELTYSDFYLNSLSLGGNDLDREIFLQLIYPQWSQNQAQLSAEINQPTDLARQERKAAQLVKLILQHREKFTSQLGNRTWGVKRRDLELRVIQPFVAQINQRLNLLLSQTGISSELIETVICGGGAIASCEQSLDSLLTTKFPEAKIIQDTQETRETQVAIGLTKLPFYPQVLDYTSQQYSDLFLLRELLHISEEPFTIEQILHKLEYRGINTNICKKRIIAILNGQLPPGFIPQGFETNQVIANLYPNPEYDAIASTPLFERENEFYYRPNHRQCQLFREYFLSLLSRKKQELLEPLSPNLFRY
ncbi:MAG: hypothetical protein SAJ37_08790 [Oscillatoria sp. PMC 1068.18]|nr:hypothetical protein [Oscillatoria sp. PMC 1076.18]MEC4988829.1 hypothetical protein [Oscillatoria sp. PMC 1068.18]